MPLGGPGQYSCTLPNQNSGMPADWDIAAAEEDSPLLQEASEGAATIFKVGNLCTPI